MNLFFKQNENFKNILTLFETVNQTTDDYLFIWDIAEDKRYFFGEIEKFYDIPKDGKKPNSTSDMMNILHPADRSSVLKSLSEIAKGEKEIHNMNYRLVKKNGEKVWINCHGTLIRDDAGKPFVMLGRISEENLRHLYNPLTGFWNKTKLRRDLKDYLSQSYGYLVFLDVDNLATINLSHGREYGDSLLKDVADLCEGIRGIASAYHVDHNYFALVLTANSEEEARSVYQSIQSDMQERCTFTAAAVPIDKKLFYNEAQLLDAVNMTLRQAKQISNNRIEFFSTEELEKRLAFLSLLEEMNHSLENGCEGFEVHYQPQLKAGSYELYGVEALLRYQSKKRGRIFPNEFIPILEQSAIGLRSGALRRKKSRSNGRKDCFGGVFRTSPQYG